MAAFPAMPLFTDAYLADTRHLTTEEHGAYLLLLMCTWRSRGCVLADNDKALARITGLTPARWRRMRPVIEAFFELEEGMWRQGKLTSVYADVSKRVARNRASGAKGGRALAAKKRAEASKIAGNSQPHKVATKAKTKSRKPALDHPEPAHAEEADDSPRATTDISRWLAALTPILGDVVMDHGTIQIWIEAGVKLEDTALPTIRAVLARELGRTGSAPKRLAYYREAVLDALVRQQVEVADRAAKTEFDVADVAHWRQLLGDRKSRFRGDYMAQNWFIPGDHPNFKERGLGPNPCFAKNQLIPPVIYADYARGWLWL